MGLGQVKLRSMAEELRAAERSRKPIATFSSRREALEISDAYSIQFINVGYRLSQGERLLGYKVGLTSREAQKQFQVFEPDFGHLFHPMIRSDESEIALSTLMQPRIEGEIAFVLGRDLKGPGITVFEVIQAVDFVTAAIEIVDTRFEAWKIGAFDTISDNGSSALFAVSAKKTLLDALDLAHVGMAFSVNGQVSVTGSGAAVMGNPLAAVAFLANELAEHGRALTAGEIILSGSLGAMLPMKPAEVYTCEMAGLGSLTLRASKTQEG